MRTRERKECEMNGKQKWLWGAALALPAVAAGAVYAQTQVRADQPKSETGYVCPLTGETLPCPDCCPLNGK